MFPSRLLSPGVSFLIVNIQGRRVGDVLNHESAGGLVKGGS